MSTIFSVGLSRTAVLLVIATLSVATAFASMAMPASATDELVSNGSFELGNYGGGNWEYLPNGYTNITDWTIGGHSVDRVGQYWYASDGVLSVDLNGSGAGTLSQDLATSPGAIYTASFDLSGNRACGATLKTLDVSAGATTEAFSWNATVSPAVPAMDWVSESFPFTAISGTTTLMFATTIGGACGPVIDNVSVTQILPADKADCKKDGWESYGVFKNQGDCVSYLSTGGKNLPSGS